MQRAFLTWLLLIVLALIVVPLASADPCCHDNGSNCNPSGGTTTSGNGNGSGGGVGNNCVQAPEAPEELLFPLAAAVICGGYVLLTRRRRAADQ